MTWELLGQWLRCYLLFDRRYISNLVLVKYLMRPIILEINISAVLEKEVPIVK